MHQFKQVELPTGIKTWWEKNPNTGNMILKCYSEKLNKELNSKVK